MLFPNLIDIATKEIVTIGLNECISDAMELMLSSEHRTIVIEKESQFFLITSLDLYRFLKEGIPFDSRLSDVTLRELPQLPSEANVIDILNDIDNEVSIFALVDLKQKIQGIVTSADIFSSTDPQTMIDNYQLKEFFSTEDDSFTMEKNTTLATALEAMQLHGLESVVAMDGRRPVGILSTKDLPLIFKNYPDQSVLLEQVMTRPVDTVNHCLSIKDAVEHVQRKGYRRIIVVDDEGDLVGVISHRELISRTFMRWSTFIKSNYKELERINSLLEEKNRSLNELATTDYLTGLYNRKMFTEHFDKALANYRRYFNSLMVFIIDIDHFKDINDTYGHNIGDKVLKELADTLKANIRSADVLARWGGEEFILLCQNISHDDALRLGEKLRQVVASKEFTEDIPVTISIGISTPKSKEQTPEEIIDEADEALYVAKKNGRDRIESRF